LGADGGRGPPPVGSIWPPGESGGRARAPGAANAGNKALFERLQGLVNAFCPGLAKTPYHIDRFAGDHHAHYVR
jgi:hypothetical protein